MEKSRTHKDILSLKRSMESSKSKRQTDEGLIFQVFALSTFGKDVWTEFEETGNFEAAEEDLRLLVELGESISQESSNVLILNTCNDLKTNLAYLLRENGRLEEALEVALDAYETAKEIGKVKPQLPIFPAYLQDIYNLVGVLYTELGEYEKALKYLRESVDLIDGIEDSADLTSGVLENSVATYLYLSEALMMAKKDSKEVYDLLFKGQPFLDLWDRKATLDPVQLMQIGLFYVSLGKTSEELGEDSKPYFDKAKSYLNRSGTERSKIILSRVFGGN